MVIRWNLVATLVAVTFAVIRCEKIDSSQMQDDATSKFEDLCPCLPISICPRVFGAKPDDAKYLGDIKKCDDVNTVRCCGASASFVVGKGEAAPKVEMSEAAPEVEIPTTQEPQPDISSRFNDNADNVFENEIPDAESESEVLTSTLSDFDENTEVPSRNEAENISNFHQKDHLNGEIEEEPAESEYITETTNIENSTEDEESKTEVVTTVPSKSHRKPKYLDNVMMVYPNSMSGIAKTTPKNMPETNEMTMFDKEIGMVHLVFSKTTMEPELPVQLEPTAATTIKPEVPVEIEPSSKINSTNTNKRAPYKFAKRRRQYRPIQRVTTESPTSDDVELKPTTFRPFNRIITRPSTPEPESPVDNLELKPTTFRPFNRIRTRPSTPEPESPVDDVELKPTTYRPFNRIRTRPSTQEPTNYTTMKPTLPKTTTNLPPSHEDEILQTSEDDKTHQNRFRLFNARHRLNYLRRSTTTTTTTETPEETTTSHTPHLRTPDKKRPLRARENISTFPISGRPLKMNEAFVRAMDTNHRIMISKVHFALKAASTENQIIEIPRSFAGVEMDNRVKKIEQMLMNKMIDAYTETKTKRRGDEQKAKERSNIQISTTDTPASNSTRPYRGKKKFELSDLLDRTLIVPITPNEARRMRSTTVRPVEDITIPTTTKLRRRLTTRVQPNNPEKTVNQRTSNIRDSTHTDVKEGTVYGRRVNMRRRFRVEPSSTSTSTSTTTTTTTSSPVPLTTEEITTLSHSTIPTILTTEISTDSSTMPNELQDELPEEHQEENESTQTVQVEETATPRPAENSEIPSDFKPSPLWSITSDDKDDSINYEQNHSYATTGEAENENILRKGHRRSRSNAFEPPGQYLYGFVPVTSFSGPAVPIIGPIPKPNYLRDDKKVKYDLPIDSNAIFSEN